MLLDALVAEGADAVGDVPPPPKRARVDEAAASTPTQSLAVGAEEPGRVAAPPQPAAPGLGAAEASAGPGTAMAPPPSVPPARAGMPTQLLDKVWDGHCDGPKY